MGYITDFIRIGLFMIWYCVLVPYARYTGNMASYWMLNAALIFWVLSVDRRIINKRTRYRLLSIGSAMALFLLFRFSKYVMIAVYPDHMRFIWYCYYVCTGYICVMSFRVAVLEDAMNEKAARRVASAAAAVMSVIVFLVLTNDSHQLAFRFPNGYSTNDYVHGPVWYMYETFEALLILTSYVLLIRKARRKLTFKDVFIVTACPLFCAGIMLMISIPGVLRFNFLEYPETYNLMYISFWEGCIVTGLLPSNDKYRFFFRHSHLDAAIYDRTGKEVYRTASSTPKSAHADSSRVLRSQPITGGMVKWFDDISGMQAMNRELKNIHQRLEGEQALLEAETTLREERAVIEEQNRLYDEVSRITKPQQQRIRELIYLSEQNPADLKKNLQYAQGLQVYIKRYINMYLTSCQDETADLKNLMLSVKESLFYLEKCSVPVIFSFKADGRMTLSGMLKAYETFERIIEDAMPSLAGLVVRITSDEDTVRMVIRMENPSSCMQEAEEEDGVYSVALVYDRRKNYE